MVRLYSGLHVSKKSGLGRTISYLNSCFPNHYSSLKRTTAAAMFSTQTHATWSKNGNLFLPRHPHELGTDSRPEFTDVSQIGSATNSKLPFRYIPSLLHNLDAYARRTQQFRRSESIRLNENRSMGREIAIGCL